MAISETAKADWLKKAHRTIRNECWYADVEVGGTVEIFVLNVGMAKGGDRAGGWELTVRIWNFNLR